MSRDFSFTDGDKTYSCTIGNLGSARAESWWWFAVAGDRQRYAPFRVEPGDTESSVRGRIIAYYGDLLARRSAPAVPRQRWSDRRKPQAGTPDTTGTGSTGTTG
jgi:hypothetical protein